MRNIRGPRVRRLSRGLLIIPFLQFSFATLNAQKAPPVSAVKYDVQTETKIKGTIDDVKIPEKTSPKDSVHITLKSADGSTIDVALAPKSFLDDMGVSYSKGDVVEINGSKVKQDNADVILAREIAKGDDRITLRDAKGVPVWNWRH